MFHHIITGRQTMGDERGKGRPLSDQDLSTWVGHWAARLRELRLRKFETHAEFAEALTHAGEKSSVDRCSSWERGEKLPSIRALPKIANVLDVDVYELFVNLPSD